MKLNGIIGKGSGKLGSSVFAISGGQQIVREYNPVVANPNTQAQIEQRAKFKLMSQLAAELAGIIVIQKMGLVSARNRFVALNIKGATYEDGKAKFDLRSLNITGGSQSFPAVSFDGESVEKYVSLENAPAADVTSVMYILLAYHADGSLYVVNSKVVTEPGENGKYQTSLGEVPNNFLIVAYGIRGNVAGVLAKYEEIETAPASILATLIAERSESLASVGFTKNTVFSPLP